MCLSGSLRFRWCDWIDDGPQHIRGVVFDQRRGDESAVMIEMFEAARADDSNDRKIAGRQQHGLHRAAVGGGSLSRSRDAAAETCWTVRRCADRETASEKEKLNDTVQPSPANEREYF